MPHKQAMFSSRRLGDTGQNSKGGSQDLMPSIMGAFDAIISDNSDAISGETTPPKRTYQSQNFAFLSPGVQKILSHVPDQEISKQFSSEESLGSTGGGRRPHHLSTSRFQLHRPYYRGEDIISSNVQKMLSNLPDALLVATPPGRKVARNSSFLHDERRASVSVQDEQCDKVEESLGVEGGESAGGQCPEGVAAGTPLGSFLHTSPHGIASRTPVGRKNLGKFLQVPSDSTVTTSSTISSEVSRPVSLTSLGSCSSSGSSNGHHQPGSAYLASAESLDSDPEPSGSQGSADSGIAEQPSMSPEQCVLQEVLDTETVYVADLHEVIQGYLLPWRADSECPLAEHLHHLFSNLEEIYDFNRSFLDDLRKANCNPTKTANAFLQNDNGFSVYNEYCTNYPRTMQVLIKLTRDSNLAQLIREKQVALGHALPLGSYLLKPVQRILKYHLLLQRLSQQCEPAHQPAVDLALTTMTAVAANINRMKGKNEDAVRVQEIQSQLYGWTGADLTALGELIAEASFRVVGARARRHVFLFEKVLLLAKKREDGALAYKSHIECSNLMLLEQVRGEPLSFQVISFDNPKNQCTLKARSPKHKRDWTLQIKRVMLENFQVDIPNHARELVMQLGEDLSENAEDVNEKVGPKPHSTAQYLERRCRTRKTHHMSNRRTSSQDRSFALGSWRRKSEPSMIPQYNSTTMPKKISKLKKAKETSCSTFYTDLSDTESTNWTAIGESNESLQAAPVINGSKTDLQINGDETEAENEPIAVREKDIQQIVSDLIMQKQDFKKVLSRQRRTMDQSSTSIWYDERSKKVCKADSLPRSFQLNDQIEKRTEDQLDTTTESVDESGNDSKGTFDHEELPENELSSKVSGGDHPDHKIYRKTAIRLSILQRLRHYISEEQKDPQKDPQKYPLHKQGSKSMGEKIANPDYVDPQKLLVNSRNASQSSLADFDLMGEREQLDMTISEKDVLNEIDKRLNGHSTLNTEEPPQSPISSRVSSQSDGYYETILDNSLTEEYVKDEHGRMVAKQDSFSTGDKPCRWRSHRPAKAPPPPIPVKPIHLVQSFRTSRDSITTSSSEGALSAQLAKSCSVQQSPSSGSSWVKAMVDRFE